LRQKSQSACNASLPNQPTQTKPNQTTKQLEESESQSWRMASITPMCACQLTLCMLTATVVMVAVLAQVANWPVNHDDAPM